MTASLVKTLEQFEKIAVIPVLDPNAGLFALVTWVLHGIRWAESNNYYPAVRIDKKYAPCFYDPACGENVWEYFFEPVMGYGYSELKHATDTGLIAMEWVSFSSQASSLVWRHLEDPDRIATSFGYSHPQNRSKWMAKKRALGQHYVKNYIRPKPHILTQVQALSDKFFCSFTVGCHVRGTDFYYADPVPIELYFKEIDRLEGIHGLFEIFLATDQLQFVEMFRNRFGERLRVTNANRSNTAIAPFRINKDNGAQKGTEVLIDILLLSQCDFVLKGAGAGGEYALWFNSEVPFTDFGLDSFADNRDFSLTRSAFEKLSVGDVYTYDLQEYSPGSFDFQRLTGFFGIEVYQDRRFQWAKPLAAIRLTLNPGNYTISIDMGPIITLWDGYLSAYLNDSLISGYGYRVDGEQVILTIRGSDFPQAKEYWLRFEFNKVDTIGWEDENRDLGAPIFSVKFTPS